MESCKRRSQCDGIKLIGSIFQVYDEDFSELENVRLANSVIIPKGLASNYSKCGISDGTDAVMSTRGSGVFERLQIIQFISQERYSILLRYQP